MQKFKKSEAEDMKIGKKETKTVIHRQCAYICRKKIFNLDVTRIG